MSKFYKAAISHWEAQRDNAIATLELYFPKSVGIGAVSYTHLTLPTTPYV